MLSFLGVVYDLDGVGVGEREGVKHGVIDGVTDGVSDGRAEPFKLKVKNILLIQVGSTSVPGLIKRYNS